MKIKLDNTEDAYKISIALTYLIGGNIYNRNTMKILKEIKDEALTTISGDIKIPNDNLKQIQFALNNSTHTIKKYFSNEVYNNYLKLIL